MTNRGGTGDLSRDLSTLTRNIMTNRPITTVITILQVYQRCV